LGRILALDYGRKRTGIAVTDPLKIIATGLTTVNTTNLFDFLNQYLLKENVECFVVGHPVQMNNQESESMEFIRPFFKKLQNKYPEKKIEYIDERFTSKLAVRAMVDAGVKKKKRQDKSLIDQVSATIILQSYLEKQNFNLNC
jgi:putative Holliday junction resolvase